MKDVTELLTQVKNKTLLVVFPHPDDETVMAAGLIRRAVQKGWRVVVVNLTKGEAGRIHIHGNGECVAKIRSNEFAKAMGLLGVKEFELWNCGDGNLRGSRSWRKQVDNLILNIKPGIVVTYDHSGISGHPDHIALSVEIYKLLKSQKGVRLLWPSLVGKPRELMVNNQVKAYFNDPVWKLDMGIKELVLKWRAMKCHRSQALGKSLPVPLWVAMLKFRSEYFAEADFKNSCEHRYIQFDLGY